MLFNLKTYTGDCLAHNFFIFCICYFWACSGPDLALGCLPVAQERPTLWDSDQVSCNFDKICDFRSKTNCVQGSLCEQKQRKAALSMVVFIDQHFYIFMELPWPSRSVFLPPPCTSDRICLARLTRVTRGTTETEMRVLYDAIVRQIEFQHRHKTTKLRHKTKTDTGADECICIRRASILGA